MCKVLCHKKHISQNALPIQLKAQFQTSITISYLKKEDYSEYRLPQNIFSHPLRTLYFADWDAVKPGNLKKLMSIN